MSRTAKSHLESLNDGREIYINGERITNHVQHPAFKNSVLSAAKMYDFLHEPQNVDRLTFRSPKTGEAVSKMWQLPTTYAELVDRRKALEAWSELSCGFFGRSPDQASSAFRRSTSSAYVVGNCHILLTASPVFGERNVRRSTFSGS